MQASATQYPESARGWPEHTLIDARIRRAQLRGTVLRLGGLLGWPPSEVKSLVEDLTGIPWQRCGCDEFESVIDEYRSLTEVIAAKHRRQARRLADSRHRNGSPD